MNKFTLSAPALFSLFLISGCNSDSKKAGGAEQIQSQYTKCLNAQKLYLRAREKISIALHEKDKAWFESKDTANKEAWNKAAAKEKEAREAGNQARSALEAFNAEEHLYGNEDFCKLNVLCPAAREEYKKTKAEADKENMSEEEKTAAEKIKEKAYKKYLSLANGEPWPLEANYCN